MIYVLKCGPKLMNYTHSRTNSRHVLGFTNLIHARSVHYNMNIEGNFEVFRGDKVYNNIYVNSSIFIAKSKDKYRDSINDVGFHLETYKEKEFYELQLDGLGLIIAYHLKHEDHHEYTFDAHVILES